MTNNTDNALVTLWTNDRAELINQIRHIDRDDVQTWNKLDAQIKDLTRRINEITAYLTSGK